MIRTGKLVGHVAWATLTLTLLSVTACGSEQSAADQTGDTLRIAAPLVPDSLSPHDERGVSSRPFWKMLFDSLYDVDVDGNPIPFVAESLPDYSNDGLTLTIPIRQGLTFHDGTPLDAASVKANLDSVIARRTQTSLAPVTAVSVVDPHTVTLTLSNPRPGFEAILATGAGGLVSPEALSSGIDIAHSPGMAGSGPYLIDSFTPGQTAVFAPAGEYWFNPDYGNVARVEVTQVPMTTTGLGGLQSGDFDMAYGSLLDDPTADRLQRAGFVLSTVRTWNIFAFQLRSTIGALSDVRVRQALLYALDRDTIAETFGAGCASVNQPFPPGSAAEVPDYRAFQFDPERARQLLRDAGVANGLELQVVASPEVAVTQRLSEIAQQMWEDVGVQANISLLPATAAQEAFSNDEIQVRAYTVGFFEDALGTIDYHFVAGGPNHLAVPEDQPLNDLRSDLVTAPSASARTAILQEMGRYIADNAFALPVCNLSTTWAATTEVDGLETMIGRQWSSFDLRGLSVST